MSRLTRQQISDLISYEADTGIFRWLVNRGKMRAGSIAGSKNWCGYTTIYISGRNYRAHHLAWLVSFGEWPALDIDHINCDKGDNRLSNLRLALKRQNQGNQEKHKNNSSGYKGVFWHQQRRKWRSQIGNNGKSRHLGIFYSREDAKVAYDKAASEQFGEFART